MYVNFELSMELSNKAIEELSIKNFIKFNIESYKNNGEFIFDKIELYTKDFLYSDFKAIIYFKNGKNEELNNANDIFGYMWWGDYLTLNKNCLYEYLDCLICYDKGNILKFDTIELSNKEIKNWFEGITAKVRNIEIEEI